MRLLLINYEYPPVGGGAANATWEIARALVQLGHEPVVLTARYSGRLPDAANPGIKVIEVPAVRRFTDRCTTWEMATFVASATVRVRRLLRQGRIEGMIAFFSIPCGPVAWWGWRGTKIPYVVSLRGGDVPGNEPSLARTHRLLRPLRHAVLRHSRAIVANSDGLKAAAEAADPFPVQVIPNGVDTEFWSPAPSPPPPTPFRFLFVGRLQPQKNVGWLLDCFAELTEDATLPPWELHVVGDGPLSGELKTQATRLGLAPRVHWHGWLAKADLRTVYRSAHVLLNPSSYEGMPNTVLEAMSCGLPVIASNVAGNDAVVIDGKTGVLSPLEGSAEWVDSLRKLCGEPTIAAHYGATGRQKVTHSHSWFGTAQVYGRFFAGDRAAPRPAETA